MTKISKGLLLFTTLFITLTLLLSNVAYASPAMASHDCRPQSHAITGGVSVTNPTYAYDNDLNSYATFRYDPSPSAGTFEVKEFPTPSSNPMAFVDFKMKYEADAGGSGEEYRIVYYVYHTDYLSADSCVLGDFTGTGSSPYVGAEDHPTNYISGSTAVVVVANETVGLGDGSDTTFYLDNTPVVSGSETIKLNGTATTAYTINYQTGLITFTTAPPAFTRITAAYSYYGNSVSGDIGFPDITAVWGITEVIIEVDCWSDYGSATTGSVSVWDHSQTKYQTYNLQFPGSKPADGVNQTIDVSSIIASRTEVNVLKIKIETPATNIATYIVDHCRLKVTSRPGPVVLQGWTGSAHAVSTEVWSDQQEPYDGAWDWTDISNIRFVVQTKTGAGGASNFDEYEAWVTVYTYTRGTMFVDPSSLTDPSSPFTVDIDVSSVDDLYAWEFKLYYDNNILSNGSVTEGTFLSSAGSTQFFVLNHTDTYNATHGRYWVTCTLTGDTVGATGSGTIATITFTTDGPSGTTPLDLTDTILVGYESTNKRLNYMVHDTTDGSVTISGVPEFPLGLALETALIVAVIYIWWRRRRKEPKGVFAKPPLTKTGQV